MGTFTLSAVDLDENINDKNSNYYHPFQEYIYDQMKVFEMEQDLKQYQKNMNTRLKKQDDYVSGDRYSNINDDEDIESTYKLNLFESLSKIELPIICNSTLSF